MELPCCDIFGFNKDSIQKRLNLLELCDEDLQLA